MLYMFFANGFEEVEAIATLDVIRRAGIEIKSVGIDSNIIKGSHNIEIFTDIKSDEISFSDMDGIILPGGMPGTTNLLNDKIVNESLAYCDENNKLICAICAAPMILGRKGLLKGKTAICFPGFEKELTGAVISDKFIACDCNIITGKGMGSAINFGLAVVSYFKGDDFAKELKGTLQCS